MSTTTNTNRAGLIQRMRNRDRKPKSELTIVLLHLAFIWGGGIILWGGLTAALAFAFMPTSEAIVLTGFILAANIFLGWLPALFVWLIGWGIRGWIGIGQGIREGRASTKADRAAEAYGDAMPQEAENQPAPHGEELDMDEEEVAAQWKAMNPYGCCMDNRDSQGYPCHGGPGCQHPKA